MLLVTTEKSLIDGQVTCEGVSIPCKIQQTDDKHLWHFIFRPYTVGIYRIHLFHNDSSIIRKKLSVFEILTIDCHYRFTLSNSSKGYRWKELSFWYNEYTLYDTK